MEGKDYRITQGYNGSFSHGGRAAYAIDFGMNIGASVCAARDGIVIGVKSDSSKGGRYRKYKDFANYITIMHNDGTYSQYIHLKKSGSKVKVGDKVAAGQLIGYSGSTGWSKGPHLHFMIFKPVRINYQTIPTVFIGANGIPIEVKSRKYYYSYHLPQNAVSNTNSILAAIVNKNSNQMINLTNDMGGY